MPRVLTYVVVIGFTIYALIDCLQTPTPRNLPKSIWLIIILALPIIGPLLWLLFGRIIGGGWGRWDDGPVGPDDDPSFLRDLDRTR